MYSVDVQSRGGSWPDCVQCHSPECFGCLCVWLSGCLALSLDLCSSASLPVNAPFVRDGSGKFDQFISCLNFYDQQVVYNFVRVMRAELLREHVSGRLTSEAFASEFSESQAESGSLQKEIPC